jgi:hypothetical protein
VGSVFNQDGTPEPVESRVRTLLSQSSHEELRWIRCECQNGFVTLRGWVPTYYLKLVAQETAALAAGGNAIHNFVKVAPPVT